MQLSFKVEFVYAVYNKIVCGSALEASLLCEVFRND